MNIAHLEEYSFIYGPGCRYVIWVQGCSIRCKGCWNTEMWSFETKQEFSVNELINRILKEKEFIEGITILGGEPLDQFDEVDELLKNCNKLGLSTMLFSGYLMKEIEDRRMTSIYDFCDILITGRYVETKRTLNHQWIGSTNQEIHFLSGRYKDYKTLNNNYIEISINDLGKTGTLGFPDEDLLKGLQIGSESVLQAHCQSPTSQRSTKAFSKSLQSLRSENK
jgi:anaerobic ribonucleoside-triphosphate reductase activating protein